MTEAKPLSVPVQLAFGVGQVGGSVIANTPAMILLFFMTDTLAIPPALAGLAVFIPKLWVIVFDPVMGRISDRTHSRWGRRRPHILWGAIFCGICNLNFAIWFLEVARKSVSRFGF